MYYLSYCFGRKSACANFYALCKSAAGGILKFPGKSVEIFGDFLDFLLFAEKWLVWLVPLWPQYVYVTDLRASFTAQFAISEILIIITTPSCLHEREAQQTTQHGLCMMPVKVFVFNLAAKTFVFCVLLFPAQNQFIFDWVSQMRQPS